MITSLVRPDCSRTSDERFSPECEKQIDVLFGVGVVGVLVLGVLVALWMWRVRRRLLERDPGSEG